jgi:hypothetical protein
MIRLRAYLGAAPGAGPDQRRSSQPIAPSLRFPVEVDPELVDDFEEAARVLVLAR